MIISNTRIWTKIHHEWRIRICIGIALVIITGLWFLYLIARSTPATSIVTNPPILDVIPMISVWDPRQPLPMAANFMCLEPILSKSLTPDQTKVPIVVIMWPRENDQCDKVKLKQFLLDIRNSIP